MSDRVQEARAKFMAGMGYTAKCWMPTPQVVLLDALLDAVREESRASLPSAPAPLEQAARLCDQYANELFKLSRHVPREMEVLERCQAIAEECARRIRAASLPSAPAPQDTALARDVRRIVRQTGERILANDECTAESDVSIAAEGFDEISRLQSFAQYLDLPSATPTPTDSGAISSGVRHLMDCASTWLTPEPCNCGFAERENSAYQLRKDRLDAARWRFFRQHVVFSETESGDARVFIEGLQNIDDLIYDDDGNLRNIPGEPTAEQWIDAFRVASPSPTDGDTTP